VGLCDDDAVPSLLAVRSTAGGLVKACHPIPTVGVTALVTTLTAVAGNGSTTVALAALAVLTGQLSIGWSNDLIDADRDRRVRRPDKPLASGAIPQRVVATATGCAVVAVVPLSLALGWRAGVVHLVAVGSGWTYNLGLKSTVLSVAPYVVTFGLLPAVATLPLPQHPWPPLHVLLAGALIGVSAHFGNVAPDLAEDAAVGVRGLPHRSGRTFAGVICCLAALGAIAVVAAGRLQQFSPLDWAMAAVAVVVGAGALAALRRDPRSEAPFYGSMIVAAIGVFLIASSGALQFSR
jgi:4-hydroxybenzoate polyprenyltransferase